MATPQDLDRTVKEVEALGRRIYATEADIRDIASLEAALAAGVGQLGGLDIVAANAGIFSLGRLEELSRQTWQDMIDVNLTGAWHTAKAAIPHLKDRGVADPSSSSIPLVGSPGWRTSGTMSQPSMASSA